MTRPKKPKSCYSEPRYEVTKANLPLSCPMPQYRLWDSHPRVYLPIEREGQVTCPYCETEYVLKNFKESSA